MNRTLQGNIISEYGSLYRYYQPVHLDPNNTCEKGTQTDKDVSCRNTASLETDTMGAIISKLHAKVISLRNQLNENHENASSQTPCINQKNDYTKSPTTRHLNSNNAAASIDVDMDASDDHKWKPNHIRRKAHQSLNHQKVGEMVPIGDGYALVPAKLLDQIDWSSYRSATRKLLNAVFSKSVLATHSMSGKLSNAYRHRPAKKRLEPKKLNDIIQTVVGRCRVPEKLVRTTITKKCAEESKMYIGPPENNKQEESSESQSPYDVDEPSDDNYS